METIFNIGLVKTGLVSTSVAFSFFNYNFLDGKKIIDLNHIAFWSNVLDGKAVNFKEYYTEYQFICDIPAILFKEEIIKQLNPKLICTVRDFKQWHVSLQNYFNIINEYLKKSKLENEPIYKLFYKFRNYKINNISLHDASQCIYLAKQFYDNYHNSIKKYNYIPMDVNRGWKDVLFILNKTSFPNIQFPHLNKTKTHKHQLEKYIKNEYTTFKNP
jgi:hypothetical protein